MPNPARKRQTVLRQSLFALVLLCASAPLLPTVTQELPSAASSLPIVAMEPVIAADIGPANVGSPTALQRAIARLSNVQGPPGAAKEHRNLPALPLMHEDIWQRMRANFQLTDIEHPEIDKQIRFLRAGLSSLVSNMDNPYLHYIVEEIDRAGMPMDLALLPLIESAFDPNARSTQNAVGLWQFIPSTASTFGLEQTKWYDGRKDLVASTDAALRYLQQLHKSFNNDWLLALAAYNTGPGNLRSAIRRAKRNGQPISFWNLRVAKETTNYVPRLLAACKLIANPEAYGLVLPSADDLPRITAIPTGRQVSLNSAATMADLPLQSVAKLNPALKLDITPPNGPHRIILPAQKADRFRRALAGSENAALDANTSQRKRIIRDIAGGSREQLLASKRYRAYRFKTHTVAAGDTLWKIAAALDTDVDTLVKWNKLPSAQADLRPGDVLTVAYLGTETASDRNLIQYRVQAGDTLRSIASHFGLTSIELRKWNPPLWQANFVRQGQLINVPTR